MVLSRVDREAKFDEMNQLLKEAEEHIEAAGKVRRIGELKLKDARALMHELNEDQEARAVRLEFDTINVFDQYKTPNEGETK